MYTAKPFKIYYKMAEISDGIYFLRKFLVVSAYKTDIVEIDFRKKEGVGTWVAFRLLVFTVICSSARLEGFAFLAFTCS